MGEPLSSKMEWAQANAKWAAALNPVINNALNQGNLVTKTLSDGDTVINHNLGRRQIGWILCDVSGAAEIYRSEPFNATTLTLTSNAVVTVSIWMF